MRRGRPRLLVPVLLYITWMGMMAVHELGHVMHAYSSGGRVSRVSRVSLPWFGFSQTFFRSNPHPHFVVWGGPVWGCVLPVVIWALRVGDAGDLIRYGTPIWVMIAFGAVTFSAGMGLWHLLEKREEDCFSR